MAEGTSTVPVRTLVKHSKFLVELGEYPQDDFTHFCEQRQLQIEGKLRGEGYSSLAEGLSGVMSGFFGVGPDLHAHREKVRRFRSHGELAPPAWFINLYSTPKADILALDFEQRMGAREKGRKRVRMIDAELDIFCFHDEPGHAEAIAGEVSAALGGGHEPRLVRPFEAERRAFRRLQEQISATDLVANPQAASFLAVSRNRAVLSALKESHSVLESELGGLIDGISREAALDVIHAAVAQAPELIETKFALVCSKTHELLFFVPSRDQLSSLQGSECHKCGKQLPNENVEVFYRPGELLKELIDGAKWLPLLAKNVLIGKGVPSNEIFVNCKIGKDEIDLVAFVCGETIVGEFKARPVNLGDLYKFAAKISHLQRTTARLAREHTGGRPRIEADEFFLSARSRVELVPLVVTTHSVEPDGATFLKETLTQAMTVENAEAALPAFLGDYVARLESESAGRAYREAVSLSSHDSASRLAANLVEASAFSLVPGSTPSGEGLAEEDEDEDLEPDFPEEAEDDEP